MKQQDWLECSAVCCMDAYQPKQKAIFKFQIMVRKIFMDYVVPDKKDVLFVLKQYKFLQAANKGDIAQGDLITF